MERIIWTHQSGQPFYVFDETHVVHFWDDGVSIHRAARWYKDRDTRLSPFEGPHVYPKALPLEFYKKAVLDDRLPISVAMEGGNLGTVKQTSDYGYGSVESGANKRRIVKQQTQLSLADDCLVLQLSLEATPVDPTTVHGYSQKEEESPLTYAFEFRFPLDVVPELFNLTASERRIFDRIRSRDQR
jgi:hypothetical protein